MTWSEWYAYFLQLATYARYYATIALYGNESRKFTLLHRVEHNNCEYWWLSDDMTEQHFIRGFEPAFLVPYVTEAHDAFFLPLLVQQQQSQTTDSETNQPSAILVPEQEDEEATTMSMPSPTTSNEQETDDQVSEEEEEADTQEETTIE